MDILSRWLIYGDTAREGEMRPDEWKDKLESRGLDYADAFALLEDWRAALNPPKEDTVRWALGALYRASLHYLARHDGYARYPEMQAALEQAEHALTTTRRVNDERTHT